MLTMLELAYGLFIVNVLFGLAVRVGLVDSSGFRIVHHALYFCVIVSLLAATVLVAMAGGTRWIVLAAMLLLLLGMSRFPGRSRGHALYATFCLLVYSAIIFW